MKDDRYAWMERDMESVFKDRIDRSEIESGDLDVVEWVDMLTETSQDELWDDGDDWE